ncbi:MAG: sigma-70 family RNA polymerase sigma factor [Pseudomonadota bacterium]
MATPIPSRTVSTETIAALIDGDHNARDTVFRTFSGPVYSMAIRILADRSLAEEVAQDTFVDVFTQVGQLRDPDAFAGWVRQIAVNHCHMKLRSPWWRRREKLEVEQAEQVEDSHGTQVQRAIDISRMLRQLPAKTRMVVWLYCVEGYSHDEIANVFGKTPSFSKTQLSRGLATMSTLSNETDESPADLTPLFEGRQGQWQ